MVTTSKAAGNSIVQRAEIGKNFSGSFLEKPKSVQGSLHSVNRAKGTVHGNGFDWPTCI